MIEKPPVNKKLNKPKTINSSSNRINYSYFSKAKYNIFIPNQQYFHKNQIEFLSTPFEIQSFRSLISIHVDAVKISSCNLTNIPFLEEVADSKIPVLLSTGMGNLTEVIEAVSIFKKSGSHLLLFQCTSNYPSKSKNAGFPSRNKHRRVIE